MLASFAQSCQGFPVRGRVPKTGNIGVSPEQIARMELPTGQLDTLKTGAAALLNACATIEQPGGTGNPDDSDMAMLANTSRDPDALAALATTRTPDHKADAQ